MLPLCEHDGAQCEVEEHHPDTGRARYEDLLLLPTQGEVLLQVSSVLHHLVAGLPTPPGGAVVDLPVEPLEQVGQDLAGQSEEIYEMSRTLPFPCLGNRERRPGSQTQRKA